MTRFFLQYLAGAALQTQGIYILGDLFEAWIGDDDDDPFHLQIVSALKNASNAGASIHIQHGNRDFLLGERFATQSGTQLLPDPFLLDLPEKRLVLSHGDALCTDDTEYQTFRQEVRSLRWQSAFLAKPLRERRALVSHLRQQSEQNKKLKEATLMDLNQQATEKFILQHGCTTFIHGHTHQAATHHHQIEGITVERWVLADWQEDYAEILALDGATLRRQPLSDNSKLSM